MKKMKQTHAVECDSTHANLLQTLSAFIPKLGGYDDEISVMVTVKDKKRAWKIRAHREGSANWTEVKPAIISAVRFAKK